MKYSPASFEEFWPYYVSQHLDPTCRLLHVAGTGLALAMGAFGLLTFSPGWIIAAPLVGYGLSWIGHFVFEGNRPASFGHPRWSLRGDLRMLLLTLQGKMGPELERAARWAEL